MLWVYGHHEHFYYFIARNFSIRQNLYKPGPHTERVKGTKLKAYTQAKIIKNR